MNLISMSNAKKIKEILLNVPLTEKLDFNLSNMELDIDNVSLTEKNEEYYDMQKTYFMNKDSTKVLKIKNKEYEVFYNIGEWGYDTRIPSSHICLGTNLVKFGSKHFSQIELSQAIEDEEYIYITKNFNKLAGKGAIVRINKGLGRNKEEKYRRRNELMGRLNSKIIDFHNQE